MPAALLQSVEVSIGGVSSTGQSLAFDSDVTVGNVIVGYHWANSNSNPGNPTVTDSLGNSYTVLEALHNGDSHWTFVGVIENGGACTVTVTYAGGASYAYRGMFLHEVSGIDTDLLVDQHAI